MRYSSNMRRLRSAKQLDADQKVRHKQKLLDRRVWRKQYGAKLKARLIELYKKHKAFRYIAAELNAEGFPAPPHSKCAKWSVAALMREAPKVGAPRARSYTSAQWRKWESDKRFKQANAQASELERQGRHAEADKVWQEYFAIENAYESRGERKPFRGIMG
jgi:hypothetical protein